MGLDWCASLFSQETTKGFGALSGEGLEGIPGDSHVVILADHSSKCWELPSFLRFLDKDQGELMLCRGDLSFYCKNEVWTENLYARSKSKD